MDISPRVVSIISGILLSVLAFTLLFASLAKLMPVLLRLMESPQPAILSTIAVIVVVSSTGTMLHIRRRQARIKHRPQWTTWN